MVSKQEAPPSLLPAWLSVRPPRWVSMATHFLFPLLPSVTKVLVFLLIKVKGPNLSFCCKHSSSASLLLVFLLRFACFFSRLFQYYSETEVESKRREAASVSSFSTNTRPRYEVDPSNLHPTYETTFKTFF